MASQLEQILAHTTLRVIERRQVADLGKLEARAHAHRPRGFAASLRRPSRNEPAVIAELKKASPSKGVIRAEFHPSELARTLEAAGAAALSVLTNEEFFQGSHRNLEIASASTSIPCLCKDFIVDPFQILEARASGADAILLIVAALTDVELKSLSKAASHLKLDVLCEVHTREELERALGLNCQMIGVNSRDLRTFSIDRRLHRQLAKAIPRNFVRVAESGIRSREDILRLSQMGYEAFLIGETLMRQPDPAGMLSVLLDRRYSGIIDTAQRLH